MHYLVTGGCGFIGSHLVRALLKANHQVTVIDNLSMGTREALPDGAELVVGDILDQSLMFDVMRRAPDGCFHLAAIPSVERCLKEWYQTSEVNVLGTVSVFEAARQALPQPIPVVYASSAAVYGATASADPLHEALPAEPISSYGVDKLSCEQYASIAWRNYRLPTTGLRFFNVYGAGQPKNSPYSGVITCFISALEQQKPIVIFGDGEQTRDFIYVGDVANALMAAMNQTKGSANIVNVCTGKAISIKNIAETLSHIEQIPSNIHYLSERVGDIKHSTGCIKKSRQLFDVPEMVSIEQGLKLTVQKP